MNSYFYSIEFQNGKAIRLFHHRQPQPRIFFRANQKTFLRKKHCEAETQKRFVIKLRGFRRAYPFHPERSSPWVETIDWLVGDFSIAPRGHLRYSPHHGWLRYLLAMNLPNSSLRGGVMFSLCLGILEIMSLVSLSSLSLW